MEQQESPSVMNHKVMLEQSLQLSEEIVVASNANGDQKMQEIEEKLKKLEKLLMEARNSQTELVNKRKK